MPRKYKSGHLHLTSVAREVKGGRDVRLTKSAVEAAALAAELMLKQLAKDCLNAMGDKKTITKPLIIKQLEHRRASRALIVEASSESAAGKREGRTSLSKASVRSIVKLHLPEGIRISADAEAVLTHLTQAYLTELGMKAGAFAEAGKRATIQKDDVKKALNFCS